MTDQKINDCQFLPGTVRMLKPECKGIGVPRLIDRNGKIEVGYDAYEVTHRFELLPPGTVRDVAGEG